MAGGGLQHAQRCTVRGRATSTTTPEVIASESRGLHLSIYLDHTKLHQSREKIGETYAQYFPALSITLPTEQPYSDAGTIETDQPTPLYCPTGKTSETPYKVIELLAQIRSEHGNVPHKLVHRLHSDRGLEFVNMAMAQYLKLHAIHQATTQGYDPSSNGSGDAAVGTIKRRARYLFSGARLPRSGGESRS